jgi:hypothetical protein
LRVICKSISPTPCTMQSTSFLSLYVHQCGGRLSAKRHGSRPDAPFTIDGSCTDHGVRKSFNQPATTPVDHRAAGSTGDAPPGLDWAAFTSFICFFAAHSTGDPEGLRKEEALHLQPWAVLLIDRPPWCVAYKQTSTLTKLPAMQFASDQADTQKRGSTACSVSIAVRRKQGKAVRKGTVAGRPMFNHATPDFHRFLCWSGTWRRCPACSPDSAHPLGRRLAGRTTK